MLTAWAIVAIIVASGVGAFIKGVTGMGYPVIAVPLLTLAVGLTNAVAITALPNLAANLFLIAQTRSAAHQTRDLPVIVGFGIVGAAIGTVALEHVSQTPLVLVLVVSIIAFLVQFIVHPERQLPPETTTRWAPAAGLLAGLMQGSIGVSGPVVATWMHGYRMPRTAYVFAGSVVFAVTGAVQIVFLTRSGAFGADRLVGAAIAAVPMAAMIVAGSRVRGRLPRAVFDKVIVVVLVVSALSLLLRLIGWS